MSAAATHEEHVALQQEFYRLHRADLFPPASLPPSPEPRLIALCGFARSGKNAVGEILEADCGFRPVAFATALKNVAAQINPVLRDATGREPFRLATVFRNGDWDTAKENPAVREFLQNLGVACRDQIGNNVWIDALFNRIDSAPARYVITDCRFPNEAEAVRQRGGSVWRIVRPGNAPVNGHVSEVALPEDPAYYDRVIHNTGTLQDLRRAVLEGDA